VSSPRSSFPSAPSLRIRWFVYFPGSTAVAAGSSDSVEKAFEFFNNLAFLIKSGRAVVYRCTGAPTNDGVSMSPSFHAQCTETHEYSSYQRRSSRISGGPSTIWKRGRMWTRPDSVRWLELGRLCGASHSRRGDPVQGRDRHWPAAQVVLPSLPDADGLNFARG